MLIFGHLHKFKLKYKKWLLFTTVYHIISTTTKQKATTMQSTENKVKKQLALGAKCLNLRVLDSHGLVDDVIELCYLQRTYECKHNNIEFIIEDIRARGGIDEINFYVDGTLFASKAALTRFYREIKALTIS